MTRLLVLLLVLAPVAIRAERVLEILHATQPQLRAADDGRLWLAYGEGTRLSVRCSTDGGRSFGPALPVATVPKLMLGLRRGPRLAAHGERLTVTAIGEELLAFTSVDGGKSWSGASRVNDPPASAREGLHDLAVAPDGHLFATWLDLRNGLTELWSARSDDGGLTWRPNERVYRSVDKSICECCHPSARFDGEGNLAVLWRNSLHGARDPWMITRAVGAAEFGQAKKVGVGTWQLNGCPMDGGQIVAWGGGRFGAIFQRNGEIILGSPESAEKPLGRGKQPVALPAGERMIAFWQQGAELIGVSGDPATAPTRYGNQARFASLAMLPGGKGTLLAFETGPAKGPVTLVIERL